MESPSIQSLQSISTSTNGSIDALCMGCTKIKSLEACLHCMQPICSECREVHFEAWRAESIKFCEHINKKIDRYLTKMSVLNPMMEQNRTNIDKVKEQIEETFQNFIRKLTQQKEDLFAKLDEIDKENKEFEIFENEIKELKDKFELLQTDLKDNNKPVSSLEFERFRTNREEVHRVGVGYSGLKKKTFKVIGDYEKPQSSDIDQNFFGSLIIADSEILKPQQPAPTHHQSSHKSHKQSNSTNHQNGVNTSKVKHLSLSSSSSEMINENEKEQEAAAVAAASSSLNQSGKVAMFGTLRVKLKRIAEQMNELQPTPKKPIIEFELPVMPRYIASYHRHVYIGDDDGVVCVAELGHSLVIKAKLKLPLTSVKGLAVNKKFLTASFSDLTAQQIASIRSAGAKKFDSKGGVMFFRIGSGDKNGGEVGLSFEKLIVSNKSHTLIAPCGIAMNDSHLFVCDRELHAVFKVDIKSGNFVQKLVTTDQEPVSIAIGEKYLVYTDGLKLELNLIDMDKFNVLKTVKFSEELFYEPFDVTYKEGGFVFVKNKADTKLIVYDAVNMSIKYSFDYNFSNAQAISYIKLKDDYLLLGYANCVTSSFKLGLFADI